MAILKITFIVIDLKENTKNEKKTKRKKGGEARNQKPKKSRENRGANRGNPKKQKRLAGGETG